MRTVALSLVLLAAVAVPALAGDNPPPGLLAKIQIATQAHQGSQAAGREFKDMKKFVSENAQLHDGMTGHGSIKKIGSLDVSKFNHDRARTPAAIGKAIGNHANDGDE